MKRKPLPKNQHFVPRVYQNLFSIKNSPKKVYVFRPHDEGAPSKVASKGTKYIASKQHYYELDEAFNEISGFNVARAEIETTAFPYENAALKSVLENFSKPTGIVPRDFLEVATLALLIKNRNPTVLEDDFGYDSSSRIVELFEEGKSENLDFALNNWSIQEIVEGNKRLKNKIHALGNLDNLNEQFKKYMLLQGPSKKSITNHLTEIFQGPVLRLQTSQAYPFISSDNPGFTWTKAGGVQTTGFGNWSEYFFVVSPTTILLSFHPSVKSDLKNKSLSTVAVKPSNVDYINTLTCWNASQYVFGSDKAILEKTRSLWIRAKAGEQIFD